MNERYSEIERYGEVERHGVGGDHDEFGDGTRCVHAGLPEPVPGQPFLPGPVFASTYPLDPTTGPVAGVDGYGRPDNATRRRFEAAIGELEGGECLAFASGMAAISAVLQSLVRPGDTILLPADGYYKARAWATADLAARGVTVLTAPTIGPYPSFAGIRLVLLETPANPGLEVCDIAALAAEAHRHGTLVAVDNTTPTPLGQTPLALGADVVVASGTKALTGHSDLLIGYAAARDPDLMTSVRSWRDATGGIPGAFDCWLAHRSLATLDLRLARQTANAQAIAEAIAGHPVVDNLRWPGLVADASYGIAARQMRRIPGVLTFTLPSAEAVAGLFAASRLLTAATSFGGTHTTADRRAQWGDDTPAGLVRLSCGIEDPSDLVADLVSALDQIKR